MLNLGMWEIMLVMVVAIVVVGPERLPSMLGWLGRQYGKLMSASDELRQAFVMEAERVEADKRVANLRQRRDEARRRIEAARAKAGQSEPVSVPRPPVGPAPSSPSAEEESRELPPEDPVT